MQAFSPFPYRFALFESRTCWHLQHVVLKSHHVFVLCLNMAENPESDVNVLFVCFLDLLRRFFCIFVAWEPKC